MDLIYAAIKIITIPDIFSNKYSNYSNTFFERRNQLAVEEAGAAPGLAKAVEEAGAAPGLAKPVEESASEEEAVEEAVEEAGAAPGPLAKALKAVKSIAVQQAAREEEEEEEEEKTEEESINKLLKMLEELKRMLKTKYRTNYRKKQRTQYIEKLKNRAIFLAERICKKYDIKLFNEIIDKTNNNNYVYRIIDELNKQWSRHNTGKTQQTIIPSNRIEMITSTIKNLKDQDWLTIRNLSNTEITEITEITDNNSVDFNAWYILIHGKFFIQNLNLHDVTLYIALIELNREIPLGIICELIFPNSYPIKPPLFRIMVPTDINTSSMSIRYGIICNEIIAPRTWLGYNESYRKEFATKLSAIIDQISSGMYLVNSNSDNSSVNIYSPIDIVNQYFKILHDHHDWQ
jgi:hypothetical protein